MLRTHLGWIKIIRLSITIAIYKVHIRRLNKEIVKQNKLKIYSSNRRCSTGMGSKPPFSTLSLVVPP